MDQGLLVRLRSYRPGQNRDPLENFITEAFCWLIEATHAVEESFLALLADKVDLSSWITSSTRCTWSTQETLGTKRPDMTARTNELQLLFEHKVWAPLGEEQLQNYRSLALEYFPSHHTAIVLITPTASEFSEHADICLTWSEIYTQLSPLEASLDDVAASQLAEFLALLKFEGLGPPAPISHAALTYYGLARHLPQQLHDVFAHLVHAEWHVSDDFDATLKGFRWGRVGIEFCRRSASDEWAPGLFLGCVLDGKDHGIDDRWHEPQLQLIIDISQKLHKAYPTLPSYQALVAEFGDIAAQMGWEFYDHLADAGRSNKYHPLYLALPLRKMLKGTQTVEEQTGALLDRVLPVLNDLSASTAMKEFIRECDSLLNG